MNLGMKKFGVVTATAACLVLGGVWSSLSGAGPAPDADGDTVFDYIDNCISAGNLSQTDSNGDGYGNACDFDYSNTGLVGNADVTLLKLNFGKNTTSPGWNPDIDANESGAIGNTEVTGFKLQFGKAPGPSACAPGPGCV